MPKFDTFNDDAYNALIKDFDVFTKIEGWVTEASWEALTNSNPSMLIHDITHFCDDVEAFADYGLSDLSSHSQAVALAECIQRLGF